MVAPETGDYTASMVTNAAATNAANVFSSDQTITKANPVINLFNTNPSSTYSAFRIRQSDSTLYNSAGLVTTKAQESFMSLGGQVFRLNLVLVDRKPPGSQPRKHLSWGISPQNHLSGLITVHFIATMDYPILSMGQRHTI